MNQKGSEYDISVKTIFMTKNIFYICLRAVMLYTRINNEIKS